MFNEYIENPCETCRNMSQVHKCTCQILFKCFGRQGASMFNNDVKDDFIMEQQVQKTCVTCFHKHELRMTHIMNSCMTLVFKQWYLSPTQLDMYMTSPWSPMCFHFFSSLRNNSKKIFCNRHSKIRDDNQQIFVG